MSDIIMGLLCLGIPIAIIFWAVKATRKKRKGIDKDKVSGLDEIFKTDFKTFNPEEFEKGSSEESSSGTSIQNYYKDLDPEEAGVFRKLNVKEIGSTGRNFIFSNKRVTKYNRDHLRRLVNKLVALYGKDDRGKGSYTPEDDEEIDQYEMWTGRNWTKNKKYPSLSVYYDEEAGIAMTVWTTANKKKD